MFRRELRAIVSFMAASMLLAACASAPSPTASGNDPEAAGPVRPVTVSPPQVNLNDSPRLGNTAARIGIVEFSDYQCPYCRVFHEQLFPRLRKEYVDTGIVQFIHKDFPLRMIHAQALPAALAANCAGMQGRFWDMYDALFARDAQLNPALYSALARRLKLDEAEFFACLKEPAREREIMRSLAEARRIGVTGTPAFVIGTIAGKMLTVMRLANGAPSFEAFAREIEKLRNPEAAVTPQTK